MKKLTAGYLYFWDTRLNKIALHSYITKSNPHHVIDEDKNKQKYGNKPEIGWIYFQILETNREVSGMLLNIVNQVDMK